jgi:hypothetical protein
VGRGPLEGAESGVGLAAQSIGSGFSDRRYSPGSFMVTSPAPWILADLRVVGSRRSNSLEIGKNPVTGRPLPCLLHYLGERSACHQVYGTKSTLRPHT